MSNCSLTRLTLHKWSKFNCTCLFTNVIVIMSFDKWHDYDYSCRPSHVYLYVHLAFGVAPVTWKLKQWSNTHPQCNDNYTSQRFLQTIRVASHTTRSSTGRIRSDPETDALTSTLAGNLLRKWWKFFYLFMTFASRLPVSITSFHPATLNCNFIFVLLQSRDRTVIRQQ